MLKNHQKILGMKSSQAGYVFWVYIGISMTAVESEAAAT
jgi:hypothetical protein